METVKIKTESRNKTGKSVARDLRRRGLMPAVFYGPGVATRSLSVSPKELLEAVTGEYGLNRLLELDLADGAKKALLTDYQYHPVTRELLHADFVQVDDQREVNVDVPFELTGKAKGTVMGGTVRQVFLKLPVRCLPGNIPAKLTHDVSALDVDETVAVENLTLPAGVTIRLKATQTVGGCYGARRRPGDEEAEAAEAGAAGGDAKAGAAAAKPAAGAAKPSAKPPAK
ncbi:MAG TPA: 50S ribosomal protein L25 [Polyangiaceae bacterium]|jgi:large subunit ribosomal protein L25|nr:50S ribosomal protein L25 [Polyangiaceae bacterium]